MESSQVVKQEFELLSQIDHGLWYAVKRDAYRDTRFLAQAVDDFSPSENSDPTSNAGLAFHDLMYNLNQAPVIAQLFNHENIVSIAGHIQTRPPDLDEGERRHPTDFIVWDFCDASNLSALFQDVAWTNTQHYLPESLCWHVLTSLMSAVTYLHDGKRRFLDASEEGKESKKWMAVDHDWLPVLHRAIEPRNIFFQQPQGSETYGMCKLGNFEHAAVTNHVITPGDGPTKAEVDDPTSFALAARRGWQPWGVLRANADEAPEGFKELDRPYTLADELWSVGVVIFTMMTGQKLVLCCPDHGCCHVATCGRGGCLRSAAARKGCSCAVGGCKHVPSGHCCHEAPVVDRPVHASCAEPVINVDSALARARYSWRLRKVIRDLLDCGPASELRISKVLPFTKVVLERYREWREGTEDGQTYRDIEDDMMARWEAEVREKARTNHSLTM